MIVPSRPPLGRARRVAELSRNLAFTAAVFGSTMAGDASAQDRRPVVGPPVAPDTFRIDLRDAPAVTPWQPGDSFTVFPEGVPPDFDAVGDTLIIDLSRAEVIEPWEPGDPIQVVPEGVVPGEPDGASPRAAGDMGPNHYVRVVESALAIFDPSGRPLAGPTPITMLWNGFGGPCESGARGDPVVKYDAQADRWIVWQPAFDTDDGEAVPPFLECVAISRTADPVAGGWFRYAFTTSERGARHSIGVWPDGYYLAVSEDAGHGLFAFDRTRMLDGAAAGFVLFTVPALGVGAGSPMLPSDLKDATHLPTDSPNYFTRSVRGAAHGGRMDRVEVFAFSVDFANPASSTLVGPTIRKGSR